MRKLLISKINFRKLQSIYKKKSDKSGQGSLTAVILASVIGTIIISSTTQWLLSMNKSMAGTDDRLEAMTIAMSEWQRLEHMSLEELEDNRENYKTPYNVGDKFTVGVNLGERGFFDNGTCNALTGDYASEPPNCFKDTTMTVYDKDGKGIYTTRSLPLSPLDNTLPAGSIMAWPSNTPPNPLEWIECNGQQFDTVKYKRLAKVFPSGVLPDLREKFLEGDDSAGKDISAGLPGWYHYAGNILTFGSNYGPDSGAAFIGGGGQVQPKNEEYHRWRDCVMDINIGGFSTKATKETLATWASKDIPITVSGSYTDGEGHSHGVTLTGSLPVTIAKYRIGLWQQLVSPTTGIADGHFLGYSDNANGMLSPGYAKGHELYGKSPTVQPKSFTVKFYVKAR